MSPCPQVSCIIIFLNEERFIEEAIESVFAQTYHNWELLLIDDGSTDKSTEIARAYVQQYPNKVRYLDHVNHENLGMSASRNLGVRNARGKYVSYLDGDDVWLPNKLERQLEILEANPEAVMVYGPLLCWFSWTGKPEDQPRDYLYGLVHHGVRLEPNQLIEPPRLLTYFLPHKPLIPSGVMVEREVIERVGGSEEIFRGTHEDAVVQTKICLTSKVYVSGEYWYKYRIHPNSWERTVIKTGKVAANRLFFLNWVKEYLSKQGVTDPDVWQALEKAFWPYRHPKLHALINGYGQFINQLEAVAIKIGKKILPMSVGRWLWSNWENYRYRSLNTSK